MNIKAIPSAIKSLFGWGSEGSVRGGLGGFGELGSWFAAKPLEDGWQRNLSRGDGIRYIPAVYACVMANSRAISQCPPQHIKIDGNGESHIQKNSVFARLMRKPNSYETWNQWMLNNVSQMLFDGESFNYLIRDKRNVIIQMHRLQSGTCSPHITPEGDLFYSVGENPMLPEKIDYLIPARDMLHLRSHTPRHPLIGESPIKAAAVAAGINVVLSQSQAAFFAQMSRPSGIISTEQILKKEQMEQLRQAWDNQSQGISQGKVPILGGGMKFQQMSITSQDAQLIEAQRLSISDICRVFGTPEVIAGQLENATLNNVQELIGLWLSMSLGSLIENIESSLERMFDLKVNERIELDESALLRMNFNERMDGLSKAVQGGVYSPNQARAKEGLHPIEGGDEVFLQAQMTPVSTLTNPPEVQPVIIPEAPEIPEEDKTVIYLDSIRKQLHG